MEESEKEGMFRHGDSQMRQRKIITSAREKLDTGSYSNFLKIILP